MIEDGTSLPPWNAGRPCNRTFHKNLAIEKSVPCIACSHTQRRTTGRERERNSRSLANLACKYLRPPRPFVPIRHKIPRRGTHVLVLSTLGADMYFLKAWPFCFMNAYLIFLTSFLSTTDPHRKTWEGGTQPNTLLVQSKYCTPWLLTQRVCVCMSFLSLSPL